MLKIGFLGPKGTFSHEAVLDYIRSEKPEYSVFDFNSITDALLTVQKGEIHEAIVPIENSLEGAINVTLDMLASEEELKIKAEHVIPIKHNLLVKNGTEIKDIKCILSHPQAIGQCIKYIGSKFPDAQVKSVYSTAGAAIEVSNGNGDAAAIGSMAAAESFGLDVPERNIQDGENNFTRFIVVAKQDGERTKRDKTSIVFSTENQPGSLYRVLDIFSLWDINMARIESRPAKNQLGRYIFFVDIMGHRDDDDIKDALTMIKRKTSFYKFLGSYPTFKIEG
jgi:prephenate dehydratase